MADITSLATVQVSPAGTGAPANGGYWNAKSGPPAWIEFTWNGGIVAIDQIILTIAQSPSPCQTTHMLIFALDDGSEAISGLSGQTYDGQVLPVNISVSNVWRLRIWTTQSQSWVAWDSIRIIGTEQGVASPLDIGSVCAVSTQPAGTGSPANGGYWNAKAGPIASVKFTFPGAAILGRGQLSLIVVQTPAGATYHEVVATMSDGTQNVFETFSGTTADGQLLRANGNLSEVESLSIITLSSPSWVAWRGIKINAPLAAAAVPDRKKLPARWIKVESLK